MQETQEQKPSTPVFDSAFVRETKEKTIEYLLRARYPLIYVISPEEERVEQAIRRIGNDRQKKVVFWSPASRGESV